MASGCTRRLSAALCVMTVCLLGAPGSARGEAPAPDVTDPPAYEQFSIIPLRVHVLSATDLPEVDCKLSDDDVRRIVGKVNTIVWHKAGIHFGLESIRREPAARQDEFRTWRDRFGGHAPLDVYPILRPDEEAGGVEGGAAGKGAGEERGDPATPAFQGVHVYYVHEMPTNGVYFGGAEAGEGAHRGAAGGFAFVKETASLRPVEGGIDEPIPRVTAHELGHALGLRHRQNWANLMQSGTTGTLLNVAEVNAARDAAGKLSGLAGVAAWREKAEAAEASGDVETATRLWGWLADVPGDRAAEAMKRRNVLAVEDDT